MCSHGTSSNPMRSSHGGFMLPAVRPSVHSILVPIDATSFADRMFVVRLTDLGGKVVANPQAELSTSAKGHLADRILWLYMSARFIGR
jgi:hypothetical protein